MFQVEVTRSKKFRRIAAMAILLLLPLIALLGNSSCSSIPFVKENRAFTRIFLVDYSTAWTASMEAISGGADIIKNHNRENGTIETDWIDSSISRQVLDMFTEEDFFLRSRYKMQVQLREGKKNDQQAVLVRVLKIQQKETNFMGGWQDFESDELEEAVTLYRIGRVIAIQTKMEETDFKKNQLIESEAISFD